MAWKRVWEPWMAEVLRVKFASVRNEDLEKELGISNRTLLRYARAMGLSKSEAFLRECSEKGLREVEYKRLTEGRCGGFRKGDGHKGTGGSFRKGHKWDEDIERKRVKAIRDRVWDERVRVIHGWKRKTKWKMKEEI